MKVEGRRGDRFLDYGRLDVAEQLLGLGGDGLVARDEDDGDAEIAGHQAVDPRLRHLLAVDDHVEKLGRHRVLEDGVRGRGAGMIADEDHGVERPVDALHHAQAPMRAADQRHVRGQLVGVEVVAVVVGVADHDLVGAARQAAVQRRVEVAAHEFAGGAPVLAAVRRLLVPADAADALEVDADEHFHALTPPRRRR